MKATGIVRRIDDLGRVVIPKEIRRTMRIREGDPLEIYTDRDGEVIFKKYSPLGELSSFAGQICETLHKTSGFSVVVTDRDTVIAASGPMRRDLQDKRLSEDVEKIMEDRQTHLHKSGEQGISIVDGNNRALVGLASPILAEGDVSGCVVLISTDAATEMSETELKLVQTVSGFLGKQMES
ncbi:MAG: AbrB/MazE/SpoVT family DNA-binding domain-containing protein [Oscillospiraceae bacterium]|nr:AbrB/MazE/SpoVT family DNA-binding domain-containing protein [Oscillospiraceae bacterium]